MSPPDRFITIYLMPDIASLQHVAQAAHGLSVSPATLGYTYQEDFSTVAVSHGAQAGTLQHELFHLLVRRSFGDVPQWLDEGTASLYEAAARKGGVYLGQPNWRGTLLRQFANMRPPLAKVISSPWFSFDRVDAANEARWDADYTADQVAVFLATARYFAFYLQERGKLGDVYRAFQARDPGGADDPGAAAVTLVARTLGQPIDAVQADYDRWLKGALNGEVAYDGAAITPGPGS
jgi:hypothetical protein